MPQVEAIDTRVHVIDTRVHVIVRNTYSRLTASFES